MPFGYAAFCLFSGVALSFCYAAFSKFVAHYDTFTIAPQSVIGALRFDCCGNFALFDKSLFNHLTLKDNFRRKSSSYYSYSRIQ